MTSIAKFNELSSVIPNYKEFSFYCDIHKEQFYYAFGDLIKHYQKYNNSCFYTLRKRFPINYIKDKNDFDVIFNKNKNTNVFKNAYSFDKNFSNYFEFYSDQEEDDKFEFYDDKNNHRLLWISKLLSDINILGFLNIFYGSHGI